MTRNMKLQKAPEGPVCAIAWRHSAHALLRSSVRYLRSACAARLPAFLLLLTMPAAVQARFNCVTNADDTITITSYPSADGDVIIPDTINGLPVTTIGDYAFEFCTGLTSVSLPDSVTNIGYGAFLWCSSLAMITVDTSNPAYSSVDGVLFNKGQTTLITYPGGSAGDYTIPPGVRGIGDQAFYDCPGLASVTIPGSVTTIGLAAFAYCSSLTRLMIPNTVTNIGDDAFDGCSGLTDVTMPGGLITIGDYMFLGCNSLTNITIPGSVTSIGTAAFDGCTSLASVAIPTSVTNIGSAAFQYCAKLESVLIPSSVASIGDYAFSGCASLVSVFFSGDAPSIGLGAFDGDLNATVYYQAGAAGWGTSFGGLQAVPQTPAIQSAYSSFGVISNQFGFIVTASPNTRIQVEASTNLHSASWTPLQTCTLTNGSFYVSDPTWTNYPVRFYRVRAL